MTLSRSADTTYPFVPDSFGHDAWADQCNRCLKALKVTFGPQPYHASAVRTPVSLQCKWLIVAIEIGRYISVSPQPIAAASWATLRLDPRIISTLFKKHLEYDRKKYYHGSVPWGPFWGSHLKGRLGSQSSPPFFLIKKASIERLFYSGNFISLSTLSDNHPPFVLCRMWLLKPIILFLWGVPLLCSAYVICPPEMWSRFKVSGIR